MLRNKLTREMFSLMSGARGVGQVALSAMGHTQRYSTVHNMVS